jgi:hypothetical protein
MLRDQAYTFRHSWHGINELPGTTVCYGQHVVADDLACSLTADHSEIVMSVKREAAADRVISSPWG